MKCFVGSKFHSVTYHKSFCLYTKAYLSFILLFGFKNPFLHFSVLSEHHGCILNLPKNCLEENISRKTLVKKKKKATSFLFLIIWHFKVANYMHICQDSYCNRFIHFLTETSVPILERFWPLNAGSSCGQVNICTITYRNFTRGHIDLKLWRKV